MINRPDAAALEALLSRDELSLAAVVIRLAWQLGLQAQPAAPAAAVQKPQLSPHAAAVLAALGPKPQGMGALAEATGLPVWQLAAALTELELAGLADQLAGRQYLLR